MNGVGVLYKLKALVSLMAYFNKYTTKFDEGVTNYQLLAKKDLLTLFMVQSSRVSIKLPRFALFVPHSDSLNVT